jgi:polysaccharide biosynthesis protein PslH
MSGRRRIAVVVPFVPSRQAAHGGGRIIAESLLQLAGRNQVALLALRDPGEPPVDDELRAVIEPVVEIHRRAIGLSARRALAEPARVRAVLRRDPAWVVAAEVKGARRALNALVAEWSPHIVQLEMLALAGYAAAVPPQVPVVLVNHDAAPDGHDVVNRSWLRHARRTLGRIDAVVTFTEADRARLDAVGAKSVRVIRPGIDLPPVAPEATGPSIVFVGAFFHEPNVEAARRLAFSIHPRVQALRADAELAIVGADPPRDLTARPGLRVTGRVPDAGRYVEEAAVVVCPLTSGGGIRIKVLDALARGKAIVATGRAIEGLDLRDGEHLLVRDTDEEFARAVATLLNDSVRRRRLGAAARAWSERNLSWTTTLDAYDRLYEELMRV